MGTAQPAYGSPDRLGRTPAAAARAMAADGPEAIVVGDAGLAGHPAIAEDMASERAGG